MKTNMIRTATFILVVLVVTSISAQNTRSFNENSMTNKLSKLVKENISNLSKELNNLRNAIQFKPDADYNYSGATAQAEVFDLSELEPAAKYYPAAFVESNETTVINNELASVLDELKESVKFQPKAEENDEIMKEIARELAEVVRYTPATSNI